MTIGAPRQNGDWGQGPEMAQRWVVKAHIDDNVCKPCKDNDGVTYRNRADAYADYPNGRGYRNCVGAEFGNKCRCKIMKRGRKGRGSENVKRDLASLIAKAQALTAGASARNLATAYQLPSTAPKACADCRDAAVASRQDFRAESNAQGNTLYLYDAIGGWDGTRAIDVAQALAGMTGPLNLHFNSPGGFIFEGAAMYNVVDSYTGGPVTSWVDGYAASAASFVMLAASPYDATTDTGGIRVAKNAFVMVHDGMGICMGTQADMYEAGDLLGLLSDSIAEIYAARTGQTADFWRNIMAEGDTWYTAQGALDVKLADLVVGQEAAPEPAGIQEAADSLDLNLFQPYAGDRKDPITAVENDPIPYDFNGARTALRGVLSA